MSHILTLKKNSQTTHQSKKNSKEKLEITLR